MSNNVPQKVIESKIYEVRGSKIMLDNVLKSERAVKVSIQIIRVFNKMREMVQDYRELLKKLRRIETRQDVESKEIWKAIRMLQRKVLK